LIRTDSDLSAARDGLVPTALLPLPVVSERVRPRRVTMVGPDLFVTPAIDFLGGLGLDARRARAPGLSKVAARLHLLRRVVGSDVIIYFSGRPNLHRLTALLSRIGVPVVVYWTGTDVLFRWGAPTEDVIERPWHWCGAPWLREELAERGIGSSFIVLFPPAIPAAIPALPDRFSVLAYVPEHRRDFYGLDFIVQLAQRLPDVEFQIVHSSSLDGLPPNVHCLGWVEDMDALISRTTAYVRPITHDGLSYMVTEALAYGRHVLWTYHFAGVTTVDTVEAAEAWLRDLHLRHREGTLGPNEVGRKAVEAMFDSALVGSRALQAIESVARQRWRRPPGRIQRSLRTSALSTLRVLLRT
jgi:glycosyltransferase involved in cell wall biosynthesis